MKHPPVNSLARRLLRLPWVVFLGHPQVLFTVPLSIALLIHMIVSFARQEPPHGFTPTELIRCVGVIVGLALFAVMSVGYLGVVVAGAMRRNGHAALAPICDAVRPRLDCIVTQSYLFERLTELAKTRRLYGPAARIGTSGDSQHYAYAEIKNLGDLRLDFPFSDDSPKRLLLPPHETLLKFDRADGTFKAETCFDSRPTAVIGVHPCDLHAIQLLDRVFRDGQPDPHYLARRDNLFIVGVDCPRPCSDGAFCGDIGSHESTTGFDVMLYPIYPPTGLTNDPATGNGLLGEFVGVMFGTEAGRAWLRDPTADGYYDPDRSDCDVFFDYLANKASFFPRRLSCDWADVPAILDHAYDSLLWQATAKRCYSCGSCNLVCPTCYCFDIQDENDLPVGCGHRERTWDGCMLREFALVAGGHNFRNEPAHRLRHRIFRKGSWIHRQTGLSGCVGCARCDRACTARISIRQILNQLSEEVRDASH